MTARDDYPDVDNDRALDEIDQLRVELERCEQRNDTLRVALQNTRDFGPLTVRRRASRR